MNQLATIQPAAITRPDQNAAAVYLASLTRSTRRTTQSALCHLAQIVTGSRDPFKVNWSALQFQHTTAIRTALAESMKVGNANRHLWALRGVLKAAHQLGQMSADDYSRAVSFKPIQGETLPRGRALSAGEIAGLLTACSQDPTTAGARDAAIIALLYGSGLRRAELASLTLADLDQSDTDEPSIKVKGKGNRERQTPITQGAAAALEDWLAVRGTDPGALFHPINKGGAMERRAITAEAIYDMLTKRAEEAGISNLSPHDLRRTFVSDLLDAGADIATVQQLAGHANIQTTAKYDRRGERAKKKAVKLLHVPYRRRAAPSRGA